MTTHQVVLFLVDGLRPDGLQQADTPCADQLIASGRSTMTARTVMPSVTLPCHMSLFHGVGPDRHGITTNTWTPQARPVPGLIDVLHDAGKKTASFFNWEQLRDLSRPGRLDHAWFSRSAADLTGAGDRELAAAAADHIAREGPHFTFVYLGCTDETGHTHGWMSPEYLAAITNADGCIHQVVKAMQPDAVAILVGDHGGHQKTHGTDSDEDMTIPLLRSRIGRHRPETIDRQIHITDIAPTITGLLAVPTPEIWIGSSI